MTTRTKALLTAAVVMASPAAPFIGTMAASAQTDPGATSGGAPTAPSDPSTFTSVDGYALVPAGYPGGIHLQLPSAAEVAVSPTKVFAYDSNLPLQTFPGDPGMPPLGSSLANAHGYGSQTAMAYGSSQDCNGAPPDQHGVFFPLRGCSFAPPSTGWQSESCYGKDGAYDCREIIGHPDLALSPRKNFVAYKSGVLAYRATPQYGTEIVTKGGLILEGCFNSWVQTPVVNGQWDYLTNCDYKRTSHNGMKRYPRATAGDQFFSTLRWWGGNLYDGEFTCASNIVGMWTGAASGSDVVINCGAMNY